MARIEENLRRQRLARKWRWHFDRFIRRAVVFVRHLFYIKHDRRYAGLREIACHIFAFNFKHLDYAQSYQSIWNNFWYCRVMQFRKIIIYSRSIFYLPQVECLNEWPNKQYNVAFDAWFFCLSIVICWIRLAWLEFYMLHIKCWMLDFRF